MREGPVARFLSRRPRRRVRRIASLEGKLPGQKPKGEDPNPQTPFVLSPSSQAKLRRTRTTFIVDLTSSPAREDAREDAGEDAREDELAEDR